MIKKIREPGYLVELIKTCIKPLSMILMLTSQALVAIEYPVMPVEPKLPDVVNNKSEEKQTPRAEISGKSTEKEETEKYRVVAVLQSGDELTGSVELPKTISFSHHRDGFDYHKSLRMNEIKSITIAGYAGEILKNDKQEITYAFRPRGMILLLHNGDTYEPKKVFPFLLRLKITTRYGTTTVFSEFGDTWNRKSGWSEVNSSDPNYHRTRAHPKSLVALRLETKSGIEP